MNHRVLQRFVSPFFFPPLCDRGILVNENFACRANRKIVETLICDRACGILQHSFRPLARDNPDAGLQGGRTALRWNHNVGSADHDNLLATSWLAPWST